MPTVSLRKSACALLLRCAPALALSLLAAASCANICAQAVGANRGDAAASGGRFGSRSIQGHIFSSTGHMPETRIRVTLDTSNAGPRTAFADQDGSFTFNGLEAGPYTITIDAGRDYEVARESVYIEGNKPVYNVPVYLALKPEANPALAGVPKTAVELFSKAVEAERKNDGEKATALLGEALAQHPQFGLAHGELGMIYYRTGQLDRAVEELKAAQKFLPEDPQVQLNYGVALLEKKDYAEAERQLRRAVKRMDKNAQAHMYLGVSLMRQKGADEADRQAKIAEAEREFQQSIKLGGDPAGRADYYLGGVYWSKRDYKRAADELENYLKISPKAPDAEQVRATVKELRGKS